MKRLLLVQPEGDVRILSEFAPVRDDLEIVTPTDREESLLMFTLATPSLVLCEFHKKIDDKDFLLIAKMREQDENIPILVFMDCSTLDQTVEAMEAGASLYVARPLCEVEVVDLIREIIDGMESSPILGKHLTVR